MLNQIEPNLWKEGWKLLLPGPFPGQRFGNQRVGSEGAGWGWSVGGEVPTGFFTTPLRLRDCLELTVW